MTTFIFADRYRAAGFTPTSEIIASREGPFEVLRKDLTSAQIIELTRLYYEIPTTSQADWFRDAFLESDKAFSLAHNGREAAVLASCLLSAALEDGRYEAALAPLTASAGRNRLPQVVPELLTEMTEQLASEAVEKRTRATPPSLKMAPFTGRLNPLVDQLVTSPDWTRAGEILKHISTNSDEGFEAVATSLTTIIKSFAADMNTMQEETEILWWLVGGWSRTLDRPLEDFNVPGRAVLAGYDLAGLVKTALGPVCAPAVLKKVCGFSSESPTVTIQQAVDSLSADQINKLRLPDSLRSLPDICPVLTALSKVLQIGESPTWHRSFTKEAGISPTASLAPLELATQVYRETLLLSMLD